MNFHIFGGAWMSATLSQALTLSLSLVFLICVPIPTFLFPFFMFSHFFICFFHPLCHSPRFLQDQPLAPDLLSFSLFFPLGLSVFLSLHHASSSSSRTLSISCPFTIHFAFPRDCFDFMSLYHCFWVPPLTLSTSCPISFFSFPPG